MTGPTTSHTSFEIQHYTFIDGWVNTWSDLEGRPIRFETSLMAEIELRLFLGDLQDSVDAGEIQPYDELEFRVVGV